MTAHAHDGTAWRQAASLHVHDGSAWRTVTNGYAHDGTAWREFFTAAVSFTNTNPTPSGTAEGLGADPNPAFIMIRAGFDGYIIDTNANLTAFGSPTGDTNATGKYWKWVLSIGDTPNNTNMTANTWYPVGDTYHVGYTANGGLGSVSEGTLNISFANDASGTGATTAGSWTLRAEVV